MAINLFAPERLAIAEAATRALLHCRPQLSGRRQTPREARLIPFHMHCGFIVGSPKPEHLPLRTSQVDSIHGNRQEVLAAFLASEELPDSAAHNLHWCLGKCGGGLGPQRCSRHESMKEHPEPASVAPGPGHLTPTPSPALLCEVGPRPAAPAVLMLYACPIHVVGHKWRIQGLALRISVNRLHMHETAPVPFDRVTHSTSRLLASAPAGAYSAEKTEQVEKSGLRGWLEVQR
mmetsp:Transcript_54712/g.119941  ORF Transcript_54712/g.119941 Transcript_54712/m.119941 type:complete len:233 (-) Transcript_54712:216-914(-)